MRRHLNIRTWFGIALLITALLVAACKQSALEEAPSAIPQAIRVYASTDLPTLIDLRQYITLGGNAQLRISAAPLTGEARFVSQGLLRYTPAYGLDGGSDAFDVQVCVSGGNCQTMRVNMLILPSTSFVPCEAGAMPEQYTYRLPTAPTEGILLDVSDNDAFCGSQPDTLSLRLVRSPAYGTAQIVGRKIRYRLTNTTTTADTIIYSIAARNQANTLAYAYALIRIQPKDCQLVMQTDRYSIAGADSTLNVLLNDSYCRDELDWNSFAVSQPPQHGTANVVLGNGDTPRQIRYTRTNPTAALDSLQYRVARHNGTILTGKAYIYQHQVIVQGAGDYFAKDITTLRNAGMELYVLQNDLFWSNSSLNIPAAFAFVSQPQHGSARIAGNKIIYLPTQGYKGTDSFGYRICPEGGGCPTQIVTINLY